MPEPQLRVEGRGIAVISTLSPEMFHPGWFGSRQLIRPDEAERAKINLVAREFTAFSLPWVEVQVSEQRLDVIVRDVASFEAGRDLVASVFRILDGLPIRAVGLNHYFHWAMPGPDALDTFMEVSLGMLRASLDAPHVRNLEIRGDRQDGYKGSVGLDLEPSVRVKGGLYVSVNDHYDVEGHAGDPRTERLQEILTERWDESAAEAKDLMAAVIEPASALQQ